VYFGRYCKYDESHFRGLLSGFLLIRSGVFEGLSFEMVVETCCPFDPEDKVMSTTLVSTYKAYTVFQPKDVSRMPFPFPAGIYIRTDTWCIVW
jgi:hypothetical protein